MNGNNKIFVANSSKFTQFLYINRRFVIIEYFMFYQWISTMETPRINYLKIQEFIFYFICPPRPPFNWNKYPYWISSILSCMHLFSQINKKILANNYHSTELFLYHNLSNVLHIFYTPCMFLYNDSYLSVKIDTSV